MFWKLQRSSLPSPDWAREWWGGGDGDRHTQSAQYTNSHNQELEMNLRCLCYKLHPFFPPSLALSILPAISQPHSLSGSVLWSAVIDGLLAQTAFPHDLNRKKDKWWRDEWKPACIAYFAELSFPRATLKTHTILSSPTVLHSDCACTPSSLSSLN